MITDIAPRLPNGILDTANEPETISLGKAMRMAKLLNMTAESLEELPRQEIVGRFIRQHHAKEISSTMLKQNATYCSEMVKMCEAEITKLNEKAEPTEEDENRKIHWAKTMATWNSQHHYNARALERAMARETSAEEANKPRTPSFPANANVSAPVMAQQVNVIVHQTKEE